MQALRAGLRFVDSISKWIALTASFVILFWIVITIFDVIMRYFFRAPTVWAYELAGLLFGPFWLLAGAYVLSVKGHVNFELFYRRLTDRGQAIIDLITYTLFFFYCFLIAQWGWDYFLAAVERGSHSSSIWGPQLAPFWLMIPLGAALILLQGVAKYIRDFYAAITGRQLG